jgi:4-hydroxy-3-methylbut-2-enyl diphosphate reductase
MDLQIAEKAGFCFGVRRAIRMVEEALSGDRPVYSLGPVIHNPQVIKRLEEQGLRLIDSLENINEGIVVIRSHGAPLSSYRSLEERGLGIVDATCPFVKKMHYQARTLLEDGYHLIIVGDSHHSEITSLTDSPDFSGIVVGSASELDGVKLSSKIGLISQTTQPMENLSAVAERLLPSARELKILNTICSSTITRQAEARETAARVQAMIVIGGRNSANTRRLVEICQEAGTRTFWVETAMEIEPESLRGLERIGLTAGASTPEWIIEEVVARIDVLGNSMVTSSPLPSGRHSNNRR